MSHNGPMTTGAAPAPDAPLVIRGRVIAPTMVLEDGVVVLEGPTIAWVGRGDEAAGTPWAAAVAAAAAPTPGTTVLPGLVDLHNHGGGGASFPDAASPAEARRAIAEHLAHGTTSLVASLVTADPTTLMIRVATLADLADAGDLAAIHIEGPFLSPVRCGAQNPGDMRLGDPGLVRELADTARGHLFAMTVAPEVTGVLGAGGVIETLVEVGALPAIGHTDASLESSEAAIAAASAALAAAGRPRRVLATHLFNGMRPLRHRNPGPIPALLAAARRGDVVVELIGDGVHLDAGTVRSVAELVGPDGFALVTDAMAATGMSDGTYVLGPMAVTVRGGVARLAGGDSIAGGTAHLLDVVRSTVGFGVPLGIAVRAASATPAALLGRSDLGVLAAGKRADVLVVDADLRLERVYQAGRVVAPTERAVDVA